MTKQIAFPKQLRLFLLFAAFVLCLLMTVQPTSAAEIDLTSLANMDSNSHSHSYVDKYDDTHHWEECILCGNVQDKGEHSLSVTYTKELTPCSPKNHKIEKCSECTYVKEFASWDGKPGHDLTCLSNSSMFFNGYSFDESGNYKTSVYVMTCNVCKDDYKIGIPVYLADGTLIKDSDWVSLPYDTFVYAKLSDGSLKHIATHRTIPSYSYYKKGYTQLSQSYSVNDAHNELTVVKTVDFSGVKDDGFALENFSVFEGLANVPGHSLLSSEKVVDETNWTITWTYVYSVDFRANRTELPFSPTTSTATVSGGGVDFHKLYYFDVIPSAQLYYYDEELWTPTISGANVINDGTGTAINGYANALTLQVQGSIVGSYYGYVSVTEDSTGTVLYPRTQFAIADDDNYDLNLNLTGVSASGGSVTVKVEDYFGKSVTSQTTIPAVDTKAPSIQNLSAIDLSSAWGKEKTVTFQILENGVGGVQVAVNKEDTYTTATDKGNGVWEIEYTFTGDVYSEKNICVYLKDALGNMQTTLIPVNKFDVSPPKINTVSFAELSNTQPFFSVNATDDGCGELQYRIKNSAGETSAWSSSAILGVSESDTYVIEVKDGLGNIATSDEQTIELNSYTVIFCDYDGREISSKTYKFGEMPEIPPNPIRSEDNTATYTFLDWTYTISKVTDNMTYTARYLTTPKTYTIVYKNWNGELLFLKTDYRYGDAVYVPAVTSVLPSDNELAYTNVFSHWSSNATGTDDWSATVTGNATYTAQFVPEYIEYTVTFRDGDGTLLSMKTDYHYGDTVVVPPTPTMGDNTYSYSFTGWSKPVVPVNGNADYTAVYNKTYINYTIGFKDWDGSTLSLKEDYHYGDSIVQPATPSRDPILDEHGVATTTYSFTGWSRVDRGEQAVTGTVTGDAIYVAQYAENLESHIVKFVDYDGTELSSAEYPYGATIEVPSNPYRVADDTYVYTFDGWSPAVSPTCTGGAIYVATYIPSYRDYTVKFQDHDGTEFSAFTGIYHKGDLIENMFVPSRPSDGETIYTFTGWNPAFNEVCTGDTTYTAVYSASTATYMVKFQDWDGTPIFVRSDYKKGDIIEVPADPNRAQEGKTVYTFTGWSPAVNITCDGNAVYTAQYDESLIRYDIDLDGSYGDLTLTPPIPNVGDEVTIHVNLKDGFILEGVIVTDEAGNNVPVTDNGDGSFTYIQPDCNVTIHVLFRPDNVINPLINGTVTISPETPHIGDTVTITPIPDEGFMTGSITVTDKTGIPISITKNEDGSVSFVQPDGPVIITVTFNSDHNGDDPNGDTENNNGNTGGMTGGSSGSGSASGTSSESTFNNKVDPAVGGTVEITPSNPSKGDKVTITVKPDPGFILEEITVTDKNGNKLPVTDLGNNTYMFIQPNGPVTVSVTFIWLDDAVVRCSKDDTCPLAGYMDVTPNAWYHDGIHYCLEAGLMVGTSNSIFSPNAAATRGQIATMLWSMAGQPVAAAHSNFSDVQASDYYADAVYWLTSTGIAAGYGDGSFGSEDAITREQFVSILWRYAQVFGHQAEAVEELILTHTDADQIQDYAVPAMKWAYSNGVILGDGENLLPSSIATRAQVAAILRSFHILQLNSVTN